MSMSNGETAMRDAMKNLSDDANYQRLEKDVTSVKNDIAALTDQITDAINTFAGQAQKQARRSYKQAREHVDSALDDASERGGAMLGAAQDAATAARDRRPCARPRLSDRRDVAPLTRTTLGHFNNGGQRWSPENQTS
jgi:predicted  nucleic acid-binding Zn-ribbon protein